MLTAFDVGVGVLVLISAILATARGLTREVLSLATWAGSAAVAIYMWQYHPEIARGFIAEQLIADAATVVVSFLVSLIVLHLLTMRIADFVVDSRIGPIDRTFGFLFGLARGLLIAIVLVIFGQWLFRDRLPDWAAQARSLPILSSMGDSLIDMLPEDLERQVTDILQRGGGDADLGEEPMPDTAPQNGVPPAPQPQGEELPPLDQTQI
ncbi:CvpA family protein [Arsenicitalea aurantiaca]|uniref:CvpA family protein n=1 Tax=Arsenicitalea aurantiaca TaxID=1783274 RepID=A0A433X3A0_9HYPH|nr:CvpA family protein [Arsenicitalea aurantiaca]RUT28543.1 CvpA family protein [Arsenicitalea aurantiaca]